MNHSIFKPAFAGLILLGIATALTGCGPKGITIDSIQTKYNQRKYHDARKDAQELRLTSQGLTRDRASYMAGICSYQLKDYTQAETMLSPLLRSTDAEVAGMSAATLGRIYMGKSQDQRALQAFRTATAKIKGDDLAWCYFYIAVIEQKMGWWSNSKSNLSMGLKQTTNRDLREMLRQRSSYNAFTLQGGAYRNKKTADQRARLLADAAQKAGLETPRVVPSTGSSGGTLYLVQFGRYNDVATAQESRRKVAAEEVIIVPAK